MREHRGKDFCVYGKIESVLNRRPVALTFGNFDGVHIGHQKLLSDLKGFSNGNPVLAITFDPHPSHFFAGREPKPLIMSLEDRVEALFAAGVDIVYVQSFDSIFSSLTADEFCEDYLPSRFMISAVLLGHNFCYGKRRSGNWDHFSPIALRLGWRCEQAVPKRLHDKDVSSSRVREAIQQGDLGLARQLLGRPYGLKGLVIKGDQKGRLLGFPTANLLCLNDILPQNGVYAVKVKVKGQSFYGALNCGFRPTLGEGLKLQIEVHILSFDDDIYDCEIEIFLFEKMRSEKKFVNLDSLKEQIAEDILAVKRFFLASGEGCL
jgi:riboflavin kinase / FMN adenylyltransferase